jgi:hypothetical protein
MAQTLNSVTQLKGTDTIVNENIKGVWQSVGGGYILEAGSGKIILYSYTSKHCYKEQNDYLTGLLHTTASFYLNGQKDTINVYLHDFGDRTKNLQGSYKFYKLKKLPGNCAPLTQAQQKDSRFLFDLFWLTLKENYAFARERQLDWEQIYKEYSPKISSQTSSAELFKTMGDIVTLTKDQHTKIISTEGKSVQYTGIRTASVLKDIFDQQKDIKDFNEYINLFFKTNYNNISTGLLKNKGKKCANGKIEWGDLTPEIGYIHIHSLAGFAANSLPRKQHVDTLNFCISDIMKSFENKSAIIVDVSFNFGGYDAAGLTIASYFTDRPVEVYTKYFFQQGVFHKGSEFFIIPSNAYRFTKPVYVLATDISRSAAESFLMQMKALPNAKIVGTNSLGIISDMLGKTIGDFYLTLSNEKYVSPKGEVFEVKGVDVDTKINVFPKDSIFSGHRNAVKQVVEIIQNQ